MSKYASGYELTPIEQNGMRQYKRIAIILRLLLAEHDYDRETQTVQWEILEAFREATEAWPFLCCSVGADKDGKLTLLGTPAMIIKDAQSELLDAHGRTRIDPKFEEMRSQLDSNSLGADFFRSEAGLSLTTGMPTVMIKLSLLSRCLVVGFSFYEAVFDGEFIGRFFSRLIDFTWHRGDNNGHIWDRTTFVPSADIDRNMFCFYNWRLEPLPLITPKDRLVCRLIEFKKAFVTDLIGRIRQEVGNSAPGCKDEYSVVAMLWVTIVHARILKDRIGARDTARLNILLPGQPNATRGEAYDWNYFGNSTVPTVAQLSVPRLLYFASDDGSHGFQGEIEPKYTVRGLADAAKAIHYAINKVDGTYVRRLMGAKKTLHPSLDLAAYNRGIDRHRTGMVFEDWSGYSSYQNQVIGTPYTRGYAEAFLPCADDKEEGKIVLLPQRRGPVASEDEIGWATWVCLDVEEMPRVLRQLNRQGWIMGEAAPFRNTRRSL
ncbi:hypothetical protein N5P37_008618 [Trichoderma harzianum]|nr:hypothetical protein N5P37_008618 [Trichoderma harzianum]